METEESVIDDVRATVGRLPTDRLESDIVTLVGRISAGTYELLVLVGELDVRGGWARSGALSCAAWLADVCDLDLATARTQVRVARSLRAHDVLDAALRTGDVSYAKARVLVPHLTESNATALVELAVRTPSGQLGAAIAAWSTRHEDPSEIDRRHQQERSVSWRVEADGMVVLTARLPPAVAGAVCAVVDQAVRRNRAPAGACLRHQRADAFVEVVTSGGGAVDAEVVVHVRGDEPARLADGTPLTDHAVTALLPDAFVSLLLHDSRGRPIDASPRRRYPTRRQRRVIDEVHAQCAHPGCTARAFLQYDHIEPFARGGTTTVDNLRRLCGPHNRARHAT